MDQGIGWVLPPHTVAIYNRASFEGLLYPYFEYCSTGILSEGSIQGIGLGYWEGSCKGSPSDPSGTLNPKP